VLGVLAVAAHIPFTGCARPARHRIRPTDNAHYEVSLGQARILRGLPDPAEVFMPQHQIVLARRCLAVLGLNDFLVGAAQAYGQGLDQNRTLLRRRIVKCL
jgi:hypothetical protein